MSTQDPAAPAAPPIRLLVVDDEAAILEFIRRGTRTVEGLDITVANNGDEAIRLLQSEDSFDLVLSDVRMPGNSGLEVLQHVRKLSADLPVILMSAVATVEEMMRLQAEGATLFLRKPFGLPELQLLLRHGHHLATRLRAARHLYRIAPNDELRIPGLLGRSPPFLRALVHLSALSRTDAPLLIGGETGTGKELVARAAHQLSPRKDKAFVAVNCSALTDTLVDSELFGHLKGSFTGALRDSPGLFRAADEGTIFLDEIGDLSSTAQARLLRVLQEREVRPVGSTKPMRVNVRVVAATHRDLGAMVEAGTFRQDLYYRLRVGEVRLPPLRERQEDILLLAQAFLDRMKAPGTRNGPSFSADAVQALLAHRWPGNVRELEATVMRAGTVAQGGVVTAGDLALPAPVRTPSFGTIVGTEPGGSLMPFSDAKQQVVDAFEKTYLTRLLAEYPAVTVAATRAGIDRKSLYRLLKKHGMGKGDDPSDSGELQAPV